MRGPEGPRGSARQLRGGRHEAVPHEDPQQPVLRNLAAAPIEDDQSTLEGVGHEHGHRPAVPVAEEQVVVRVRGEVPVPTRALGVAALARTVVLPLLQAVLLKEEPCARWQSGKADECNRACGHNDLLGRSWVVVDTDP